MFWVVTVSLPFMVLIVLEISLRILNYDGNLDLFIPAQAGYEDYLQCNPNVARRYFTGQTALPAPPRGIFLRDKPKNGCRIFVLGESSAAGFPYETNASFPNILARLLSDTFPGKKVEVINVAMSAINSYAMLDMMDEILRESPDALLIYAGHNEYYGALGVGSVQSLGNSRWLIRTYLKLERFKIFLLLRDFLGWLRFELNKMIYGGNDSEPSSTLMESIVAQQTIPFGSPLYEAGKMQFEENMNDILQKAAEKKVPVVLSELVSNLRDQPPFISVRDKEGKTAQDYFDLARQEEADGDYAKARQNYFKAKDYDALRFRAPEEFNDALRSLAKQYSCPIVPTLAYFENASPNGVIGNSLILEHLHPNINGYFLIAKAFYETMKANKMINSYWPPDSVGLERGKGVTQLDSVYGAMVIQHLKSGWPFQPKSVPNRFMENFRPANHIQEIAFAVMQTGLSLEVGHMELGDYYENHGELERAFDEYEALMTSIPQVMDFYKKAAGILLMEKKYDRAEELLKVSLGYKETVFAYKWLGQIDLMNKNYGEAISYLTRADSLDRQDVQVVFNLSRAYYLDGRLGEGDKYFIKLQSLSPKPEDIAYLNNLRASVRAK